MKATGTGGAPRWRQDFDRRSRWPKFAINNAKKWGFLFFMQVPALIQKHWQSPRVVILKAVCRFVVLLLSTFCGFYNFSRGFCLRLWQPCSILCRPPQRSSERPRYKNVSAMGYFPRKSWSIVIDARRSRCPVGLRFQEARLSRGVARVVCEPLWAKISIDFGRNTTTLSKFIGFIDLTDFP